jgi:hypothetical protein
VNLPARWFREIERLARRRNISETEILEHAVHLLKSETPEYEPRGSIDEEESIFLKTLARRVPISRVKEIVREANRYFGGLDLRKMTPEQRTAKAKKAAAVRWRKERKKRGQD